MSPVGEGESTWTHEYLGMVLVTTLVCISLCDAKKAHFPFERDRVSV